MLARNGVLSLPLIMARRALFWFWLSRSRNSLVHGLASRLVLGQKVWDVLISCNKYMARAACTRKADYIIPVKVDLHREAYTKVKTSESDEHVVLRGGKLTTLNPPRRAFS